MLRASMSLAGPRRRWSPKSSMRHLSARFLLCAVPPLAGLAQEPTPSPPPDASVNADDA